MERRASCSLDVGWVSGGEGMEEGGRVHTSVLVLLGFVCRLCLVLRFLRRSLVVVGVVLDGLCESVGGWVMC